MNHKVILHRPKWANNTIRFTWTSEELDLLFGDNLNYSENDVFEQVGYDNDFTLRMFDISNI